MRVLNGGEEERGESKGRGERAMTKGRKQRNYEKGDGKPGKIHIKVKLKRDKGK